MAFQTCFPDPRLRASLLSYWRLDRLVPGQVYAAAPKRHVELVVNIGAPQYAGRAPHDDKAWGACWLTGLREKPIFITPTGSSVLFGVRFRDFAVPGWLSEGIARNPHWTTDLDGCSVTARLVRALAAGPPLDVAAAALDAFFLRRVAADPRAETLGRAIAACERDECLRPAAILGRIEADPRRVRSFARNAAGMTVRRFARLARFDRALLTLSSLPSRRLADVAQDVGYFDESHMAKDFAFFSGTTPAEYRRARAAAAPDALPHHLFLC